MMPTVKRSALGRLAGDELSIRLGVSDRRLSFVGQDRSGEAHVLKGS
jgi:hypothetical protein